MADRDERPRSFGDALAEEFGDTPFGHDRPYMRPCRDDAGS
jgi:hypothetical protein